MSDLLNKWNGYLARILKKPLYFQFSRLAKNAGIKKNYLILSFDCDTPEDAEASKEVAHWFKKKGIPAVFAVPGKRLEAHSEIFKGISNHGFEFINHGYSEHAAYDKVKNRYYSTTWYHQMTRGEVTQDIKTAHQCVFDITGIAPKGFRAPHFGHFQKPEELSFLYALLSDLKYEYTSTTLPKMGLRKGPLFKVKDELVEFPVTGTFDYPFSVLDSWQFIGSPESTSETALSYQHQFKQWLSYLEKKPSGILNLYVDPSHIVNFKPYFEIIENAVQMGFTVSTYSNLLSDLS